MALVVAFVALITAGWFALRQRMDTKPPAATPDRTQRPADRPDEPSLDAPAKQAVPRSPIEPAEGSIPSHPVATEPIGTEAPTLIVSVVSKSAGEPLSRVRVYVSRADARDGVSQDVDGTRGDVRRAPISDEHGRVELEVPSGVALVLVASSQSEGCGRQEESVTPLGAHERREIEVRVPCGDDLHFFGRLLDEESRSPVSNARVRMMRIGGGTTDDVGKWIPDAKAILEVRTDAAGRFDLEWASWAKPYLRIDADGYGSFNALLQSGHEAVVHEQVLLVSRAASLHASLLDVNGKPVPGSSIQLKARGFTLQTGGEVEEPGTWIGYPDETWRGEFDARGRCAIDALPAHVPLALEILRDGHMLLRESDPLQLDPGQVLERAWTIGGGARIEGRIVDQKDAPVAQHEIWLLKKSGPREGYVAVHDAASAAAKAKSDASGRFRFEDVPIGTWWIAAAPGADALAQPTADDVASRTQTVEVASSATQSVTLIVSRGLLVRGRVLDPDDKPVPEVFITCTQVGEWFPGRTRTDDEGAFVLGPLTPGTCRLVADGGADFAASDTVTAEPGQSGIILRLHAAGKISGRVVDAATGDPCAATVHVTPEHEPSSFLGGEFEGETRDEGRFLFESLPPDRYAMWFATADGRFGSLSGIVVTAGKESGDHVVKVVPGGTLVIRSARAEQSVAITIVSGSEHLTFKHAIEAGKTETRPVPAGRITVQYEIGEDTKPRKLDIDIGAGETREVVLKDGE